MEQYCMVWTRAQGNLGNSRNPGVNCSIRPMDLEEVAIVNGKEISVGPSANAGGGFRGDILQQIALQLKIFYVELSILLLFQSNIIRISSNQVDR